ncbi:hypothetical protein [Streptomyces sp. HUAS TT7]|uniref:hypothetical protein n=1 Tax=Streptomyces sp. HUAS TT7 TaxID=3447507 RepID=UPI003F659072
MSDVRAGSRSGGTPQFGALLGDHLQTGNSIALGPGVAIGRHSQLNSGTTIPPTRVIPAHSVISNPLGADIHVRPRVSGAQKMRH